MSDVAERVKKIVVEHLGVEETKVTDTASFIDDLGADSLDIVELVMAFEEEFEVEIPDDAAEKITTVKDAITFIDEPRPGQKLDCDAIGGFWGSKNSGGADMIGQARTGTGKTLATVAGAAAGAYGGNEAEKSYAGRSETYRITVRTRDGRLLSYVQDDVRGLRIGDRVRVSQNRVYADY